MNKVILMGRLSRDPETRYTQTAEPIAVTKYSLAVPRKFKRQGEADVDFINCVAFGKTAEFAQKYYQKGKLVSVVGHMQNSSWNDKDGNKRISTEVIIEDQYFAESKTASENRNAGIQGKSSNTQNGFYPIDDSTDDYDLPF